MKYWAIRFSIVFATCYGWTSVATAAQIMDFYSGRVDAADLDGAGHLVALNGIKTFTNFGPGFSLANSTTVSGAPRIQSVGFVGVTNGDVGGITGNPLTTGTNTIVGIYALSGTPFTPVTGGLGAQFDRGELIIFDRGALNGFGFNPTAPSGGSGGSNVAWLDTGNDGLDHGDFSNNVLATYTLVESVNAILQGPPGSPATDAVSLFDPTLISSSTTELGGVDAAGSSQIKLDLTGGDWLDYNGAPDYNVSDVSSLLVQLDQRLRQPNEFDSPVLSELDLVFDTLLPDLAGDGNFQLDFAPSLLGPDVILSNLGGQGVPGSQVAIPEPTSVAIWLIAGLGAVAAFLRMRKRAA